MHFIGLDLETFGLPNWKKKLLISSKEGSRFKLQNNNFETKITTKTVITTSACDF